jgi:hypothetical protein
LPVIQSDWVPLNTHFDIVPDKSDWSKEFVRPKGYMHPDRNKLRNPPGSGARWGLIERQPITRSLFKVSGVYLIADSTSVIYVGRAENSESIGSRLGKHRVKLTCSHVSGVHHPEKWRTFGLGRFRPNDDLQDIRFSYFSAEECLAELEAEIFQQVKIQQGTAPLLNSGSRIKGSYKPVGIQVQLPSGQLAADLGSAPSNPSLQMDKSSGSYRSATSC